MKAQLIVFAITVSLFGCLVLSVCTYYTWKFGQGDTEVGNFNRFVYITKIDPVTKSVDRSWADAPTAERTWFTFVNMWFVGTMFLIAGPGIVALEYAFRDNRHF